MKKLLIIAHIYVLAVAAPLAFAQFTVEPCPRGLACPSGNAGIATINVLLTAIIDWLLSIAFGLAVLFLVIGGIMYIFSAGNEERAEKARNTVLNAIIGIILIVLSYAIVTIAVNAFTNIGSSIGASAINGL